VIGTNIDPNATVTLQDDRADWDDAAVTDVGGTFLIFVSHVKKIHREHGIGSLTVTITNPDTTSASMDVEGTYES
jgi:hypothetical protein